MQAQVVVDASSGRNIAIDVRLLRDSAPTSAGFRFPVKCCRSVAAMFIDLADLLEAAPVGGRTVQVNDPIVWDGYRWLFWDLGPDGAPIVRSAADLTGRTIARRAIPAAQWATATWDEAARCWIIPTSTAV
jgi:hypothetical protein